jgi:hypothetical protein
MDRPENTVLQLLRVSTFYLVTATVYQVVAQKLVWYTCYNILKSLFAILTEQILSAWSLQELKFSHVMSHVIVQLNISMADCPGKC